MPTDKIFINQHLQRLSDATPLAKSYLQRGMVAKVQYEKINGELNYYWVLVLEPNFKLYFHCLDLNHIRPQIFERLSKDFPEVISENKKIKRLELAKLQFNENSRGVYTAKIKNKLLQEGYRTFLWKNIRAVTVFNYKYKPVDMVEPKDVREATQKTQELKINEDKLRNNSQR
jgi:hypothetical protein